MEVHTSVNEARYNMKSLYMYFTASVRLISQRLDAVGLRDDLPARPQKFPSVHLAS